jgi:aromatic-L-amino-acid decarboxylase
MVLRLYGVEGLQQHIRRQVGLAKEFEDVLRGDSRFEIVTETSMGLVCFRLKVKSEVALV